MSRGFYSSDTLRFCAFEAPLSIHVNPNRQAALLVALLLFGAALRFYGLDEKIIWHDEVATRVLSAGATLAAQMKGFTWSFCFFWRVGSACFVLVDA